ncbi:MAG: glycine cleavage system protein GcvH [Verrucomicrobia bacterium]|nr:MAG: glycine cleavage system protein GcvH [Verrucomicrobiota bacterium]
MSDIPTELRYASTHEWVRLDGDLATVGISDHAQAELTDIVYVELPEVGADVAAGDSCAVVESVKTASDVYAPLSGKIIAVNEAVAKDPALINTDPYGEGWLFQIKPSDLSEYEDLLDADAYAEQIGE